MVKLNLMGFLCLLMLMNCRTLQQSANAALNQELDNLDNVEARKNYLETIFHDDQKFRKQDSEIMIEYGIDSKEYKAFVKKIMNQDSINIVKIEKYLDKYGHPTLKEYGDIATSTPNMVIHHSPHYEDRVRNFKYFYEAYLNQDIDISFYLNRMYEMKFGYRFKIKGLYSSKAEIDQLMQALNLK